jgi:hypothetical protein
VQFIKMRTVQQLQQALHVFVGKTHEQDSLDATATLQQIRRHGAPGCMAVPSDVLSPVDLLFPGIRDPGLMRVFAASQFTG